MSACEACWSEASVRAALLGGSVVTHYRALLAENPEHDDDGQPEPGGAA